MLADRTGRWRSHFTSVFKRIHGEMSPSEGAEITCDNTSFWEAISLNEGQFNELVGIIKNQLTDHVGLKWPPTVFLFSSDFLPSATQTV